MKIIAYFETRFYFFRISQAAERFCPLFYKLPPHPHKGLRLPRATAPLSSQLALIAHCNGVGKMLMAIENKPSAKAVIDWQFPKGSETMHGS
ncbi:hypothetical protein HMPREF1870_02512 [Bacteroidales bacterium KA00344]|nr:hypothetical protein HMPREF1870_02512 [Bacteroidales bacterium KA00344]